ncbi:MAG: hypothetical protein KBA75_01565 [Alphaproteobacteria bacterium]|nr:hypothetical protein [Alphaproteobacteria bacterium]
MSLDPNRIIDISGINKADLLVGLYNASAPVGYGFLAKGSDKPLTYRAARKEIASRKTDGTLHIDVLRGRPIKAAIGGDKLDPWLYDRENGLEKGLDAVISVKVNSLRPQSRQQRLWRAIVDKVYKV